MLARADDPRSPARARTPSPAVATVGHVERLRSVRVDRRVLDGLLAIALAVALQLRLAHGHDDTLVNVVGGLCLTLPLAARRRAPLAVACVFAATVALNAILGGGLYTDEPPPPPPSSLIAGAVMFYSLGAYAEERRALVGAALGVAGLWTAVIATDPDVQSFLFSTGLVAATP